eukprot:2618591-Prymnesium_polylepis.1
MGQIATRTQATARTRAWSREPSHRSHRPVLSEERALLEIVISERDTIPRPEDCSAHARSETEGYDERPGDPYQDATYD